MMENWFSFTNKGNLLAQAAHEATERGPVAKARRAFMRWWNRDANDKKEVHSNIIVLIIVLLIFVLRVLD